MDQLRLVNVFGKSCLMINSIFSKNNGYSSSDTKILQFMLSELSDEVKESVTKLL